MSLRRPIRSAEGALQQTAPGFSPGWGRGAARSVSPGSSPGLISASPLQGEAGFTLLEVIVATAIMATAIIGLFGLVTQSLSNAAQVREYDRAAMLARTQMNELIALDKPPIGRELTGEIDADTGWEAVIEPWEVPGGATGSFLARIDLTVWWRAGGERKQIQLEGFRRVPVRPEMDLQVSRRRPGQLF